MRPFLVELCGKHKRDLRRRARKARDRDYAMRCLIVLRLAERASTVMVERQLQVARATVSRVAARFRAEHFAGLVDHRIYNGRAKVTAVHLRRLEALLDSYPTDHGWKRPTWTRELLALQLKHDTGLGLSVTHIGRLLRRMGARWKRPKPIVLCPWPRQRRLLRLATIRRLIARLSRGEAAFYVDEMDIHLNPKIGPDWMPRGVQKVVVTPGQNQKRYVAGALNARSNRLTWVFAEKKNSELFIALVEKLRRSYVGCRRLHIILDNYIIHNSRKTRDYLASLNDAVVLHFLPPYCPDHNRIERAWEEVHANSTRNHRCPDIDALVREVDGCLRAMNPYKTGRASIRR